MEKTKKCSIKKLRDLYSRHYMAVVNMVIGDTITMEDVDLLCQFLPGPISQLENIKQIIKQREHEAAFNEEFSSTETVLDKEIKSAKRAVGLLTVELHKLKAIGVHPDYEPEKLLKTIAEKEDALTKANSIWTKLIELKDSIEPKRKPGRPKKEENGDKN